jgi:hypothetical protein
MTAAALLLHFFCVHCDTWQDGSFDDITYGVCPNCFDCNERTTIRIESDISHSEHRSYYARPHNYDLYRNALEIEFRCGTEGEAVRLAEAYAAKLKQPVNLYIYPDWTVRLVRVVGVKDPHK